MSSSTRPEAAHSEPDVQTDFRRKMRAWRKLLAHCARKPGRKSVHRLRVATLRLQAVLEFSLSCMDAKASSARSVERWVRQAKKLRHALGPVRQADVSLGKLSEIEGSAWRPTGMPAPFPKERLAAIEKIEHAVTRRRKAAAKKLLAGIERRGKPLKRLSKDLETAHGGFLSNLANGVAAGIQSQIAAAAAEFPVLDAGNLHEFRKRVKKTRYLAEVLAPLDPAAAHRASMLKRIVGAIGEWHDWQALADEAARHAQKSVAAEVTAEFLRARAWRALHHAQALCTSTMASLLNGAADGGGSSAPAQKPHHPVISAAPGPGGFHAQQSHGVSIRAH